MWELKVSVALHFGNQSLWSSANEQTKRDSRFMVNTYNSPLQPTYISFYKLCYLLNC